MSYTQSSFNANAKTLGIAVTSAASTSIALPATGSAVRIVNEGPNVAFVSIGVGSQTATLPPTALPGLVTSTPIGLTIETVLTIPAYDNVQISAICRAAQTAQLNIQVGEGGAI